MSIVIAAGGALDLSAPQDNEILQTFVARAGGRQSACGRVAEQMRESPGPFQPYQAWAQIREAQCLSDAEQ